LQFAHEGTATEESIIVETEPVRDCSGNLGAAGSGMRVRYLDHGHHVQAVFYSPEGSTMQLRDTAQLGMHVLDGDTVVSSQGLAKTYLALMSVAEDGWKVRVLQEVP
jgi:hypothetical protein